jgi:hypothetical protein
VPSLDIAILCLYIFKQWYKRKLSCYQADWSGRPSRTCINSVILLVGKWLKRDVVDALLKPKGVKLDFMTITCHCLDLAFDDAVCFAMWLTEGRPILNSLS